MNPKVSDNRLKKEKLIAELKSRVDKAKGMVFTNYQGLTHQQMEGLKRALKKVDGEFVTTKNSLMLRALADKLTTEDEKSNFKNPTATLFIYSDIVDPLKELSKTIKNFSLPLIKFGIIDGKTVTDKEVIKISSLPPLPVLQAQLLGIMMGPVAGLHRALNWNLQKLVMTLKAIETKKA